MKAVKTKYNVGDEVWTIVEDKCVCRFIVGFYIRVKDITTSEAGDFVDCHFTIKYDLFGVGLVEEQKCFASKKEAYESYNCNESRDARR